MENNTKIFFIRIKIHMNIDIYICASIRWNPLGDRSAYIFPSFISTYHFFLFQQWVTSRSPQAGSCVLLYYKGNSIDLCTVWVNKWGPCAKVEHVCVLRSVSYLEKRTDDKWIVNQQNTNHLERCILLFSSYLIE